MDYRTHIVGGIGAAYGLTQLVPIELKQVIILYGCCALGSILPDIDHPEAFISRFIPIIPFLINKAVGHRTFTHSILFATIVFLIVGNYNVEAGTGVAVGIVSHILLDMLSPYGVAFLYPFIKKRIKIM